VDAALRAAGVKALDVDADGLAGGAARAGGAVEQAALAAIAIGETATELGAGEQAQRQPERQSPDLIGQVRTGTRLVVHHELRRLCSDDPETWRDAHLGSV